MAAGSFDMDNLRIDGARLWASLMEMAEIGATAKGGCCRLALTDLDRQGRDLFARWCTAAGCTLKVDQMGNIFARRPARDGARPPVVTGSHLDTQPTGGKFDGVYGVLAGIEVIRTLNDAGFETDAPLEVAVWTNEEGARFQPAMIGSGVAAGVFDLDTAHGRRDIDGATLGAELARIGYLGEAPCGGTRIGAYFEAHIEQGPILEAENKIIGVVTGSQGQRWFEARIAGAEAHAGTTPMDRRRDALLGAARLVAEVNRIALDHAPDAVTTVGRLQASPDSPNTVPGQAFLTIDLRHPRDESLSAMVESFRQGAREICRGAGLELKLDEIWYAPPIAFDETCVQAVRAAAEAAGFAHRDIVSGAGHDACYMSRVAPTAMIFVPCKDGISHNEIESATPEDLAAGANVLLRAILSRACA